MMRSKTSSAMQKCYDDAYLQSSTAIYFEGQSNEAEALRSWKQALDTIYRHNAYRVPANYRPQSEVEKALQDSLKDMELQCKERVDLLEALKRSREDVDKDKDGTKTRETALSGATTPSVYGLSASMGQLEGLGEGTIRPMTTPELSRPPPLPQRPTYISRQSGSHSMAHTKALPQGEMSNGLNPLTPTSSLPSVKPARTPSPEKKKTGMLRTLRAGGKAKDSKITSSRTSGSSNSRQPAATNAASLAWTALPKGSNPRTSYLQPSESSSNITTLPSSAAAAASGVLDRPLRKSRPSNPPRTGSADRDDAYGSGPSSDYLEPRTSRDRQSDDDRSHSTEGLPRSKAPAQSSPSATRRPRQSTGKTPMTLPKMSSDVFSYRKEYTPSTMIPHKYPAAKPPASSTNILLQAGQSPKAVQRREMPRNSTLGGSSQLNTLLQPSLESGDDSSPNTKDSKQVRARRLSRELPRPTSSTPNSSDSEAAEISSAEKEWEEKVIRVMKHLPKGVDETAARQILNEIIIHGDEVHWDDIAGLDVAKAALKETVVYPFLRPDLFMGLREPARGMLLFGPPGTGKTMLARAVATESRSTFFAISASSLTSKFLGESEKLVRALFALARALAPSIIFVDEIDSLLSSRSGSGEHEATRRIKTEFLIQWSDLAKAAAGREMSEKDKERGDASRVLVLAATNLPWAIDEAARRRFVRRQYIPLPESHVRRQQLKTLLSHQKCHLSDENLNELVDLSDGFSGSDITALAKDAAMGPLRSLGEKLLQMSMDEIRPIMFEDFQASLVNIRPSVSPQGLKEYEDWAREFGERGG